MSASDPPPNHIWADLVERAGEHLPGLLQVGDLRQGAHVRQSDGGAAALELRVGGVQQEAVVHLALWERGVGG